MDKPIMVVRKNAEATTHKIRIPKEVIQQLGLVFSMEVYEDRIILVPIKKGE